MDNGQIENSDLPIEAEAIEAEHQEEMVPKSRVEQLVKKAKLKGRDSMQEQLEALRQENEALKSQGIGGMQAQAQQSQDSMQSNQAFDVDALTKQVTENMRNELQAQQSAAEQAQLEAEMQKVAETYHSKMAAGKELYHDFEDVMSDFDPATFPNLVYLVTNADNSAEIMYDIAQNPNKFMNLGLLSERNPKMAAKEIAKLSQSIKANQQAMAQEKSINPPLSRMQPSPTGQDSGDQSIADFKKRYRG